VQAPGDEPVWHQVLQPHQRDPLGGTASGSSAEEGRPVRQAAPLQSAFRDELDQAAQGVAGWVRDVLRMIQQVAPETAAAAIEAISSQQPGTSYLSCK
jgi:hypothetical protein